MKHFLEPICQSKNNNFTTPKRLLWDHSNIQKSINHNWFSSYFSLFLLIRFFSRCWRDKNEQVKWTKLLLFFLLFSSYSFLILLNCVSFGYSKKKNYRFISLLHWFLLKIQLFFLLDFCGILNNKFFQLPREIEKKLKFLWRSMKLKRKETTSTNLVLYLVFMPATSQ